MVALKTYDAANNRLQMRRESTAGTETESTYYSYAADNSLTKRRVQNTSTDTYYYYDNNGSRTVLVEGGAATYYQYNAQKLNTVIAPPSEAATYFYYDAQLTRYGMSQADVFTYFLWEGLNPLEERNADGSIKARYTHGYTRLPGIGSVDEAQRVAGPGSTTYYQYPLMDLRGTAYALADVNANILTNYTLDAFGRPLAATGGTDPNVPNELIYQTNWITLQIGGKWYGISKYRIYDFETGRFTQRDLIGFAGSGLNLYVYVNENPISAADATGLGGLEDCIERCVGQAQMSSQGADLDNIRRQCEAGCKKKQLPQIAYTEGLGTQLWETGVPHHRTDPEFVELWILDDKNKSITSGKEMWQMSDYDSYMKKKAEEKKKADERKAKQQADAAQQADANKEAADNTWTCHFGAPEDLKDKPLYSCRIVCSCKNPKKDPIKYDYMASQTDATKETARCMAIATAAEKDLNAGKNPNWASY